MNLHQLHLFYVVAQTLSVGQAAKKLHISQPAVSKQLKQLETTYGVRLLEAQGRGIQLTPFGKTIFQAAHPLFEQAAYIETLLTTSQATVLQLAGTQLALNQVLTPALRLHAQLKVLRLNTTEIIDRLQRHQLDLALLPKKLTCSGYRRFIAAQDHWVFVAAKSYPITAVTLAQLRQLPLIIREPGSTTQAVLTQVLGTDQFEHPLETNDQTTAMQLVRQQQGIYFCAAASVQALLTAQVLKILTVTDYQPANRTLYLYENQDATRLSRVQACRRQLITAI